jgi:hypothetical protein
MAVLSLQVCIIGRILGLSREQSTATSAGMPEQALFLP